MTLTRANTEFLTCADVGPLMTAAGMDGTTVDGTNADLNGPIGRALHDLGHAVASFVLVANADVDDVTDAQTGEFLDRVILHTLEAVLGNLDDVDITVGPRSEKLSQLAAQAERRVARLRVTLGAGMVTPAATVITLNIAEHD